MKHADAVKAFSLTIRWTKENNLFIEDLLFLKWPEKANLKYIISVNALLGNDVIKI